MVDLTDADIVNIVRAERKPLEDEIERLRAALKYARNLIGPDEIIDSVLKK